MEFAGLPEGHDLLQMASLFFISVHERRLAVQILRLKSVTLDGGCAFEVVLSVPRQVNHAYWGFVSH
jgi:hypothetical protein